MKLIKEKLNFAFAAIFFMATAMISGCTTYTSPGGASLTTGPTINIDFGFLKDPNLWAVILTVALIGLIVYLLARNFFLFRDNNMSAIIFSIIVALLTIIVTPSVAWITWLLTKSIWLLLLVFVLVFVLAGLSKMYTGGHGHLSDDKAQRKEKGERTKDRIERSEVNQIFKRSRGYLNDVRKEVDNLENDIQNGRIVPGSTEENRARSDVEAVMESTKDAIRQKANAEGALHEIKPVIKFIDKARGKLMRGDYPGARGFLDKAEKQLKKFRKSV